MLIYTNDKKVICTIRNDSWIYENARHDHGEIYTEESIVIDDSRAYFLFVPEPGVIAGIVHISHLTPTTLTFHPYLFKKHRHLCRKVVSELHDWFLNICPKHIYKLNVTIPCNRKILHNLAVKMGYTLEGIDRKSMRKDGVLWDRWCFGITRDEVEKCQMN